MAIYRVLRTGQTFVCSTSVLWKGYCQLSVGWSRSLMGGLTNVRTCEWIGYHNNWYTCVCASRCVRTRCTHVQVHTRTRCTHVNVRASTGTYTSWCTHLQVHKTYRYVHEQVHTRTGTYTSKCTHVQMRTRAGAHMYRCTTAMHTSTLAGAWQSSKLFKGKQSGRRWAQTHTS